MRSFPGTRPWWKYKCSRHEPSSELARGCWAPAKRSSRCGAVTGAKYISIFCGPVASQTSTVRLWHCGPVGEPAQVFPGRENSDFEISICPSLLRPFLQYHYASLKRRAKSPRPQRLALILRVPVTIWTGTITRFLLCVLY